VHPEERGGEEEKREGRGEKGRGKEEEGGEKAGTLTLALTLAPGGRPRGTVLMSLLGT
jgi:hypothetical protein